MKLTGFSKTVLILTIVKGIFVTSLILSLVLWSIPVLSFNSGIWLLFQERSGVLLGPENLKTYNELIVEFFRTGLRVGFLNERELSHMEDVRNVISIANLLFAFSFISLISGFSYFSKHEKRFLLQAIRKSSLAVFVIALVLSIVILVDFNAAFFSFHEIFFVRNFIFPADNLLKILYPDEFFQGLSAFYLLSIMVVSLVVAVISHKLKLK